MTAFIPPALCIGFDGEAEPVLWCEYDQSYWPKPAPDMFNEREVVAEYAAEMGEALASAEIVRLAPTAKLPKGGTLRPATPAEQKRYGVLRRLVGSRWYKSSHSVMFEAACDAFTETSGVRYGALMSRNDFKWLVRFGEASAGEWPERKRLPAPDAGKTLPKVAP